MELIWNVSSLMINTTFETIKKDKFDGLGTDSDPKKHENVWTSVETTEDKFELFN